MITVINSFNLSPTFINQLLWSEELDNPVYTLAAASLSPNTQVAHDGTNTADTLTADGTSAAHRISQSKSWIASTQYSMSVEAKAGTNNFLQILMSVSAFGSGDYANFDLSTGSLGTVGGTCTAAITDLGNGWYRCSITATTIASPVASGMFAQIVAASNSVRGLSYTTSSSIHLRGFHVNPGALGTYQKTTSIISN